ncbi:MAG: MCE family protein [Gammaproteobacteria bacterium]|nr:MAG: MCE family protein [Gammaproteobacteria bacterium]
MESDKHYFIEGLFVIVFSVAAAFFFVWLSRPGNKDDVLYRIRFTESVSGLALGDPVKYLGVDVGTVKTMSIDAGNPHRVQVEVRLRKEAPVKTDTKATLKIKGITGVNFIELSGGSADARALVSATPEGQIPEIPSEKSAINTMLEQLPKVIAKFSVIEDQTKKVVSDVGETAAKVKENPSLLLRSKGKKDGDK